MAKGTDFGGVHSRDQLGLIQQKVVVGAAEPKTNFVNIPGTDGTKDFTEQPAGRVTYKDRKLSWTFALYPSDDWAEKLREVTNALSGRRCKITLDENPDYYFDGRVAVKSYPRDKSLRQITVEATCSPYQLKQRETVRTVQVTTTVQTIRLANEFKVATPRFKVTAETVIGWNGGTLTLSPGEHMSLDVQLPAGVSNLTAKTVSGTGTLTITYQEGSL